MNKRKVVIILVCYCIASLIALKYHSVLSSIERDGTEFLFDAKRILNGQGYNSDFWPFGYMVTIAIVNFLTTIDFFTVAKLITLVSGIGALLLTYLIGRKVFSEKVALLAMLILASNHLYYLHSFLVETDMLFVFFFLLSIYYLIKGDGWIYFLLAGAATGIAYMIKYGVYAFFPVVIILTLINIMEKRGVVDSLKKLAIFIIAFLIFSSPWLINNTLKNGSPFYSKHYVNIAWGMNRPQPMPSGYWGEYFRINEEYTSMKDVLSDTNKFVRNWTKNIKGLPENIMSILPLLGFFVLPAYLMVFKSLDRHKLILILISFSFLCLVTIAYTWDRYLLPLLPVLSIFIAYCIYDILPQTFSFDRIIKGFSVAIPFRTVVVTILILFSITNSFRMVFRVMKTEQVHEFKIAGEWLKGKLGDDDWLMVPEPQIAWYAGTDRFVKYPKDKDLQLDDAVKAREQTPFFFIQEGLSSKIVADIDYFIYDKRWWVSRYPSLMSQNGPKVPDNFIRVFSTRRTKTEIIIYEIVHR